MAAPITQDRKKLGAVATASLAAVAIVLGVAGLNSKPSGVSGQGTNSHIAVDGETIYVAPGLSITVVSGTPPPEGSSSLPPTSPSPTQSPSSSPAPTASSVPTPSPSAVATPVPSPTTVPSGGFLLISQAKLMTLPTTGPAWAGVLDQASRTPDIDLSSLDSNGDVITLAKALTCARIGTHCSEVTDALIKVQSSPVARALELARGLGAYVLAADLTAYRDPTFVTWVGKQLKRPVTGGPATVFDCANVRPNNWGTWCRSSRLIVDLYLGTTADVTTSIALYRGWLGDRSQYSGYAYGDTSWQANPSLPVGINPVGATKSGHNIDGVLPDDQRRAGSFSWPPPCENYVSEAMQGVTLEAQVLANLGQDSWNWSNQAIRRAVEFKYSNSCSFIGDDSSIPFITDKIYGTHHAGSAPSQPGKGIGYWDWLMQ